MRIQKKADKKVLEFTLLFCSKTYLQDLSIGVYLIKYNLHCGDHSWESVSFSETIAVIH